MTEKYDILDDDLRPRAEQLTDRQLLLGQAEKVNYPPEVLGAIQEEMTRRSIRKDEVERFQEQYDANELAPTFELRFGYFFVLCCLAIAGYAYSTALKNFLVLVVVGISLWSLQRRFRKGKAAGKWVWSFFRYLLIVLCLLSYFYQWQQQQ